MIYTAHLLLAFCPLVFILTSRSIFSLTLAWRIFIVCGAISIFWSTINSSYPAMIGLAGVWILYGSAVRVTVLRWRLMKLMPIARKKRIEEVLKRAQDQLRGGATS